MSIPLSPDSAKNPTDLPSKRAAALRRLGITNPGTTPTEDTPLVDLLLHALTPHGGPRPDRGIIHGVAAHLEALVTFTESGPLTVSLELLARSLRVALDLGERLDAAEAS